MPWRCRPVTELEALPGAALQFHQGHLPHLPSDPHHVTDAIATETSARGEDELVAVVDLGRCLTGTFSTAEQPNK